MKSCAGGCQYLSQQHFKPGSGPGSNMNCLRSHMTKKRPPRVSNVEWGHGEKKVMTASRSREEWEEGKQERWDMGRFECTRQGN